VRQLILIVAATLAAACNQTEARQAPSENREEIEEIVRDYILDNPEIIRDALIELNRREQAAQVEELRQSALANYDRLIDERAPVLGAEGAELTIVEFFDYNCPHCRRSAGWVQQTLEKHGDRVRVVMRDWPVRESVTGTSVEALRASHAARLQGKYAELHFALMGATGGLTSERIDEIADSVGVDVDRMRDDMETMEIDELISDTMVLAAEIGIQGTPFYVVGDQVVPGASIEMLESALRDQLTG